MENDWAFIYIDFVKKKKTFFELFEEDFDEFWLNTAYRR